MKTLVVSATVILLLCASLAVGQVGYPALGEISYEFMGGGARAMAMGNSFVGLANDVSGGSWNPSGTWMLEGPMISLSYNLYTPRDEFSQSLTSSITKNDVGMNAIGNFAFVAPIRIKGHPWVFNFNYNRSNNNSQQAWLKDDLSSNLNPDTYVEDRSYLRSFSFGMATRIFKQLSLGVNVNIYDGRRIFQQENSMVRDSIVNPVYGTTLEIFTEEISLDSTTSSQYNFTIGSMYKFGKFNVGAVVRTPFTIKNNTDRSFFRKSTYNNLTSIDESDTTFVVDSLAKQDIPLSLAFGIGITPNEKLSFAFDVNYQNYGSANWYYRDSTVFSAAGDRTDFYNEIPIDWNNTLGLGGGVEYMLTTDYGRIPLRAGFRFDQLPQPKEYTSTTSYVLDSEGEPTDELITTRTASGRQTAYRFSLGTGIHWGQIEFDFAWQYTTGAEYTQSQMLYDVEIAKATFKQKAHDFRFGFTGRF